MVSHRNAHKDIVLGRGEDLTYVPAWPILFLVVPANAP